VALCRRRRGARAPRDYRVRHARRRITRGRSSVH
jgi:hypothetical protein